MASSATQNTIRISTNNPTSKYDLKKPMDAQQGDTATKRRSSAHNTKPNKSSDDNDLNNSEPVKNESTNKTTPAPQTEKTEALTDALKKLNTDKSPDAMVAHDAKVDNFVDKFESEAMKIQGSGWVYLARDGSIKTIKNHQIKLDIVLLIDWWEHAWLLDYGSDKKKYLKNQWRIIDWDIVETALPTNLR